MFTPSIEIYYTTINPTYIVKIVSIIAINNLECLNLTMTQYTLINHVVHNYEKVVSDNYLLSILLYCQLKLYHCHETFAKICLKIDMLIK